MYRMTATIALYSGLKFFWGQHCTVTDGGALCAWLRPYADVQAPVEGR
jgi:hypothetical protein